jgi:predicted TIM-barrel fold metal-dependent hydrolase
MVDGNGRPKLFDVNVSFGPFPNRPPGAPEDAASLLELLDQYDIARALVCHTVAKWLSPTLGNERLLQVVANEPRLDPCWVVMPAATKEVPPEKEQVAQLLAAGARAARLCPVSHLLVLEPWVIEPLAEALAEKRVPVLLDFDNAHYSEPRHWDFIAWLLEAYPDLPVILLRQSHADFRVLFPLMDRSPNLYVETSYLGGHSALIELVERYGAERFIFGTGLPTFEPSLPITTLSYGGLDDEARAGIAGKSLQRLLDGCLA